MSTIAKQVYDRVIQAWGPQQWWPADSPFEVMVGAVLVQNTNWKNVERAIENLKSAAVLAPQELLALELEKLQELIRPAGYFRNKAKRLRALVQFFVDEFGGEIVAMQEVPLRQLRERLLSVHGIGPETADSILLYAVGQPALVVDAYTLRIFARHGWVPYGTSYDALQQHLAEELPVDTAIYNEFHALMVQLGKAHCRKAPLCDECPLQQLLPANGVVEQSRC
ncbi:endonuclease III domain-containing protein [Bythopirellula goksoeyrii]|uniref:Ultraviolet N-glycosylase/AP lyase n=1 Tax=Bythopirellula goksoeyrii TaxID=1400387 RepID=A0A5B9QTN7_9BACT|nr:endonuclease III domain-containing protein [Bythopirellula goksoeyrii]QEG37471.1 Ultraviolet N-glycosylase/AP lyase [Bythopirellula goksoeyrii]